VKSKQAGLTQEVKSKQAGTNPGGGGQINKSSQASSTANHTQEQDHQPSAAIRLTFSTSYKILCQFIVLCMDGRGMISLSYAKRCFA
jgi:hypothetical protein